MSSECCSQFIVLCLLKFMSLVTVPTAVDPDSSSQNVPSPTPALASESDNSSQVCSSGKFSNDASRTAGAIHKKDVAKENDRKGSRRNASRTDILSVSSGRSNPTSSKKQIYRVPDFGAPDKVGEHFDSSNLISLSSIEFNSEESYKKHQDKIFRRNKEFTVLAILGCSILGLIFLQIFPVVSRKQDALLSPFIWSIIISTSTVFLNFRNAQDTPQIDIAEKFLFGALILVWMIFPFFWVRILAPLSAVKYLQASYIFCNLIIAFGFQINSVLSSSLYFILSTFVLFFTLLFQIQVYSKEVLIENFLLFMLLLIFLLIPLRLQQRVFRSLYFSSIYGPRKSHRQSIRRSKVSFSRGLRSPRTKNLDTGTKHRSFLLFSGDDSTSTQFSTNLEKDLRILSRNREQKYMLNRINVNTEPSQIVSLIENCQAMICVASQESVQDTRWKDKLLFAYDRKIFLLVIALETDLVFSSGLKMILRYTPFITLPQNAPLSKNSIGRSARQIFAYLISLKNSIPLPPINAHDSNDLKPENSIQKNSSSLTFPKSEEELRDSRGHSDSKRESLLDKNHSAKNSADNSQIFKDGQSLGSNSVSSNLFKKASSSFAEFVRKSTSLKENIKSAVQRSREVSFVNLENDDVEAVDLEEPVENNGDFQVVPDKLRRLRSLEPRSIDEDLDEIQLSLSRNSSFIEGKSQKKLESLKSDELLQFSTGFEYFSNVTNQGHPIALTPSDVKQLHEDKKEETHDPRKLVRSPSTCISSEKSIVISPIQSSRHGSITTLPGSCRKNASYAVYRNFMTKKSSLYTKTLETIKSEKSPLEIESNLSINDDTTNVNTLNLEGDAGCSNLHSQTNILAFDKTKSTDEDHDPAMNSFMKRNSLESPLSLGPEEHFIELTWLGQKFISDSLEHALKNWRSEKHLLDTQVIAFGSFMYLLLEGIAGVNFPLKNTTMFEILFAFSIPFAITIVITIISQYSVLSNRVFQLVSFLHFLTQILFLIIYIFASLLYSSFSIHFMFLSVRSLLNQVLFFETPFRIVFIQSIVLFILNMIQIALSSSGGGIKITPGYMTAELIFSIVLIFMLSRKEELKTRLLFLLEQRLACDNIFIETSYRYPACFQPRVNSDSVANVHTVFISYKHSDISFATKLERQLLKSGFAVWIDKEGIKAGEHWREEVAEGIDNCFAFIFIVTPASVQSTYCREELEYAYVNGKPILPVILKDSTSLLSPEMHSIISAIQWIHFDTNSFHDSWLKLKESLERFVSVRLSSLEQEFQDPRILSSPEPSHTENL